MPSAATDADYVPSAFGTKLQISGYVNPNEDQGDGLIRDQSGALCR